MTEDPEKEALSFIMDIDSGAKVTLLYHGDGDGVCSAVMVYKCLQRRGISNINPLPLEKGRIRSQRERLQRSMVLIRIFLLCLIQAAEGGHFIISDLLS